MIDQHNSLAEKFLKKGFWLYLFSFIIAPLWYLVKIIISWELSVAEVGILYGIISLITLFAWFNDFWMTESLNKFIPQYIHEKKYDKIKWLLILVIIVQLITALSIFCIFHFWSQYIALNYFNDSLATNVLKIFSIFFVWLNLFQVISTFYMSVQNTFLVKIVELIRMWSLLLFVLTIFFLDLSSLENYSYSWLFWLTLWIITSYSVFYFKYYNKYLKGVKVSLSKKDIKKIIKYAFMIFLWAQAATILWQIDMQMIIYLLWTTDAWYYTNYLSIVNIPFMLIWPIFGLLFPIFSEMYAKNQKKSIRMVKQIFSQNFIIIWIFSNLLFFIFSDIIAFILFWEKFIASGNILKYSILFLIFNFLLQINFNIMWAIWKVWERVKITILAIFFNIITNIVFINLIWVSWAALATWLWWLLIWIMSELTIKADYSVKYNFQLIIKNIIILGFLSILTFLYIIPIFNNLDRLSSLGLLVIISVWYLIAFILLNIKIFKNFISEIRRIKKTS